MNRSNPTSRRARVFSAVGIGILLVLGIYAGATAYVGSQTALVQQQLVENFKTQVEGTGFAQVTGSSYQRGFFSSTQVLEVTLGKKDDGTGTGTGTGNSPAAGVPIVVTNHIQHGPLPGLRSVGRALVDTDIVFADPALQKKVAAALGDQRPVIRTGVSLGGDIDTHIAVPKGQYSEDGQTVSWQALAADTHRSDLKTTARIEWPELRLVLPQGELVLAGLSGGGNVQKLSKDDPLGVGDQALMLERLSFKNTAGDAAGDLTLGKLKIATRSTLDGGFYNASLLYDIGDLAIAKRGESAQSYRNAQLHLSVAHLAREPLARMAAALSEADRIARQNPGQPPELSQAQQQALLSDATDLLKAQPVLTIDRLSLTRPSGELLLTAKATVPEAAGITPDAARMIAAFPPAALGLVKLQARLQAPEVAVSEMLSHAPPAMAANLVRLVQAGLVRREGETLISDLDFSGGKATVNGIALGNNRF